MSGLRIEVEREYKQTPVEVFIAIRLYDGDDLISETLVPLEVFDNG